MGLLVVLFQGGQLCAVHFGAGGYRRLGAVFGHFGDHGVGTFQHHGGLFRGVHVGFHRLGLLFQGGDGCLFVSVGGRVKAVEGKQPGEHREQGRLRGGGDFDFYFGAFGVHHQPDFAARAALFCKSGVVPGFHDNAGMCEGAVYRVNAGPFRVVGDIPDGKLFLLPAGHGIYRVLILNLDDTVYIFAIKGDRGQDDTLPIGSDDLGVQQPGRMLQSYRLPLQALEEAWVCQYRRRNQYPAVAVDQDTGAGKAGGNAQIALIRPLRRAKLRPIHAGDAR